MEFSKLADPNVDFDRKVAEFIDKILGFLKMTLESFVNFLKRVWGWFSDNEGVFQGAAVGIWLNAWKYVVSTAGRSTNVLNIFDKSLISKLGNPKWWVRYDRPHGSTNFNHININEAITGLKDPHIPISSIHMEAAKYLGKILEFANKAAPYIAIFFLVIDIARLANCVYKDCKEGTTKNTATTAASMAGGYAGGFGGAVAGSTIGTAIVPGLGTLIGAIVGGMTGGGIGSSAAKQFAESFYEEPLKKSD